MANDQKTTPGASTESRNQAAAPASRIAGPQTAMAAGRSGPRWHRLYFALAAFDLITVSFSLYVNHRLMQVYTNSVAENRVWADRLKRYSEISLLAAQVNAPGNDVFETLDVEETTQRVAVSHSKFNRKVREARDDVLTNVPVDLRDAQLKGLTELQRAVQEMVREAESIFAFFRANERGKAGPRMAIMDKKYYQATLAAAALINRIQDIQEVRFFEQTALADSMRKLEYVIAGFIAIMVLGVTAYGNKMSGVISENHAHSRTMIKALQESEGRLRSILDTTVDGITIIDQDGCIVSFNAAAEGMTGWRAEEVIGQGVGILATPPHADDHDEYVAQYLRTGQTHILGTRREVMGMRKDGTSFPLYLAVSEVRLGDRCLFTGIMRDLTELKKKEDTIRRHGEILERTVAERTADLATAKDLAEEHNRAKSAFLANMSHELRTPLHGILSFANFGIKKHATAERKKLLAYFQMIEQSGQTLLVLLNDVLDLAKLESGAMSLKFRPTDLHQLIESVVAEFSALAAERNVDIRVADPGFRAMGHLDPERMKQVVRNLLSNALKFSPRHGLLKLWIERDQGKLIVSLSDQGPGIPEGEHETVFDKFVQSSTTETGAGGTGLGLAICRQIVTGHQGRIWVENNPDRGATFKLGLPMPLHDGREPMDLKEQTESS